MPPVPSGAKYFRFSGKPDVKVYPFVRFLAKGVDKFPALKDKKILVFGDSISDTLVSLGGPERYPEYLKKMTECVIVPYAVSASGFGQDGSNSTYGNVDNKIWQQIELAHTNAETCDLIIVAAGTNDWDFGTPLGQFSDIELEDMVTPSFYFLVEKAIKKLASYFPTQRCLFVTPLPRNQERSGTWVDQHTTFAWQPNPLTDYAKAIKEVCAWHSIPVLDMMNDSNMRLESAEARLLWTEDGLHPTNYYAATIYAPMVIRELTRCLVPYYAQTL
jgi:lysophospholipase L1-like esterase